MKRYNVKIAWRNGSTLVQASGPVMAASAMTALQEALLDNEVAELKVIRFSVLDMAEDRDKKEDV